MTTTATPVVTTRSHGPVDWLRLVLRGVGQLLITLGVIVLLFTVYELKITGIYTRHEQSTLNKQIDQTWDQYPSPTVKASKPIPYVDGKAIAKIYFPTLNLHYVVVEGVSRDDLKKGPGHYPGTARPGGIGNVVISGHRTTYLEPFNRVDELHAGDPIVIETQGFWYTYSVVNETVVAPTAIEVTYPVPGQLHATPTERLLTLTTCNPKYSARTRLVVHGKLTGDLAKAAGVLPPALQGKQVEG